MGERGREEGRSWFLMWSPWANNVVLVHADYVDMIHPPPSIQNKTSAPIGAWKCNSPPIKETIIVRPTDRRTHRQTETDRVLRKVTLPPTSNLCFGSWCLGYSNSDGLCNVLVRLNIVICIPHFRHKPTSVSYFVRLSVWMFLCLLWWLAP